MIILVVELFDSNFVEVIYVSVSGISKTISYTSKGPGIVGVFVSAIEWYQRKRY